MWEEIKFQLQNQSDLSYFSTLKRKKFLSQATMWMNPEDIMLSENTAVTKRKTVHNVTCMRYLKGVENNSGGYQGLRRPGTRELLLNGYRISDFQDEKVLEKGFATLRLLFNTTELYTCKWSSWFYVMWAFSS